MILSNKIEFKLKNGIRKISLTISTKFHKNSKFFPVKDTLSLHDTYNNNCKIDWNNN